MFDLQVNTECLFWKTGGGTSKLQSQKHSHSITGKYYITAKNTIVKLVINGFF